MINDYSTSFLLTLTSFPHTCLGPMGSMLKPLFCQSISVMYTIKRSINQSLLPVLLFCIIKIPCISYTQRIYISDRTHRTPQRLPNMCLTQPLPAPSDSQVVGEVFYVFYRQSRKRLGETHVWKTQRDAVRSIANMYSLVTPHLFICK